MIGKKVLTNNKVLKKRITLKLSMNFNLKNAF